MSDFYLVCFSRTAESNSDESASSSDESSSSDDEAVFADERIEKDPFKQSEEKVEKEQEDKMEVDASDAGNFAGFFHLNYIIFVGLLIYSTKLKKESMWIIRNQNSYNNNNNINS